MKKIIITLSIMLLLISCSASGPVFKPEPAADKNTATVYIYRPWKYFNAAGYPDIYINDKHMFALKNQGYGVVHLNPNQYVIRADKSSILMNNWYPGPNSINLTIEANKEYYIRVSPQSDSITPIANTVMITGSTEIILVPKILALKEISETKKVN